MKRVKKIFKNYLHSKSRYKFFLKDWIRLTDLDACAEVIKTMRFSKNLRPTLVDAPQGKRIIIIAPHPDDEILGPGGTLLKALNNHCEALVIYLTKGSRKTAAKMEIQSEHMAAHFGFKTYRLNHFSSELPVDRDTTKELADIVNDFNPDIIYLPILLDDHDDHRRASHLLFNAYQDKLLTRTTAEIWAYAVYSPNWPNIIVDISDNAEKKREAMHMLKEVMNDFDWAHWALGMNAFNTRYLKSPTANRYIEAFFCTPFKAYIDLCAIYFQESNNVYYRKNYITESAET